MSYIVNKQVKRFKDLNLSFTKHPITDDVTVKSDEEAVKFAIKNLLLTRNFEVPFHPEIGSSLSSQLFENYNNAMKNIVAQEVSNVILNYEPRAEIRDVLFEASPSRNQITIAVVFKMVNVSEPITLSFLLERTR